MLFFNVAVLVNKTKILIREQQQAFNHFPTIHHYCYLLSHLLYTLISYLTNNTNPNQNDLREQSDQDSVFASMVNFLEYRTF